MSHDQKPSRVRLLGAGDTPQRRRHDTPPVIVDGAIGTRDAPAAPAGGGMKLALIFVAGCALGGAALAGLGW